MRLSTYQEVQSHLTTCASAVFWLQNGAAFPSAAVMIKFILLLGVTMVAAPGVPGGGVMAALGLLQSVLGFNEIMLSLMIALYITQDSFGTACNISGDGALSAIVDKLNKLFFKKDAEQKCIKKQSHKHKFVGYFSIVQLV